MSGRIHKVDPPEHIEFEYELANPSVRTAAWLVDACIQAAFALLAFLAASALDSIAGVFSGDGAGWAAAFTFIVTFALQWVYFSLF